MDAASQEQTELLRNIWNEMKALGQNLGGRIDAVRSDLGGRIDETNRRLDETRTELSGRLDQVTERLDQVTERLDHVTERLDGVEGAVRDLAEQQLDLTRAVRAVAVRHDGDLDELRGRVGRLEEKVPEGD